MVVAELETQGSHTGTKPKQNQSCQSQSVTRGKPKLTTSKSTLEKRLSSKKPLKRSRTELDLNCVSYKNGQDTVELHLKNLPSIQRKPRQVHYVAFICNAFMIIFYLFKRHGLESTVRKLGYKMWNFFKAIILFYSFSLLCTCI